MDGDQLFIVIEKYGKPITKFIEMVRTPGTIEEEQVEQLFSKASRVERTKLEAWLPTYFDDVPIGPATYVIRWLLYNELPKHKNSAHPMHEAWKVVAPIAIALIEFVMDIRKGEWTEDQINQKMQFIQEKMQEIRQAQNENNWFAKTVTSSGIQDVQEFVAQFNDLQTYINLITGQRKIING